MIDPDRLTQLIKLMVDNELTEMDLRDGDEAVVLKRGGAGQVVVSPQASAPQASTPSSVPAAEFAPAGEASSPAADPDDGLEAIVSPMVGTFYSAPDPESPPFVTDGSKVGPETVVCIVEAMKVFSEIKAETAGVVERVLVRNGDPVEFGQKLFMVRKG